jgi:hypothetical protein
LCQLAQNFTKSFQGPALRGLARIARGVARHIEDKVFVTGGNGQLDAVIDDRDYYINVIHTPGYIAKHWGQYFTILDIVDGMAANQALLVMRNDN